MPSEADGISSGLFGFIGGCPNDWMRPTGCGCTYDEAGPGCTGCGAGVRTGPLPQGSSKLESIEDSRAPVEISEAGLPLVFANTGWIKTSAEAATIVATNVVDFIFIHTPWVS